jgi:hypothetical protein
MGRRGSQDPGGDWAMTEQYSCVWGEDDDGVFDTDCGNRFVFNAGKPGDNGFMFCPYCGKNIKVIEDDPNGCT